MALVRHAAMKSSGLLSGPKRTCNEFLLIQALTQQDLMNEAHHGLVEGTRDHRLRRRAADFHEVPAIDQFLFQ
jgi:hypothetical protein